MNTRLPQLIFLPHIGICVGPNTYRFLQRASAEPAATIPVLGIDARTGALASPAVPAADLAAALAVTKLPSAP